MNLHEFLKSKWDTFGELNPEQLALLPYVYAAYYDDDDDGDDGEWLDVWPPELAEKLGETEDLWLWNLLHEIASATGAELIKIPDDSGCFALTFRL